MSESTTILAGSDGWLASRRDDIRGKAEEWVLIRQDERQPGQIYQELRSFSFFGAARTIFIERIDAFGEEDRGELNEALVALAPNVTLFLTTDGKSAAEVRQWLPSPLKVNVETEPTAGANASVMAKALNIQIDPDLRALLEQAFADDPIRMKNEIEKLALLLPGGTADIEIWRGISSEPGAVDGWRFARAVMARDLPTAEAILKTWASEGGGSHSAGRDLLGALAYVLRQYMLYKLNLAKGQGAGQAAKATPGRFGSDDQKAASTWSLAQLGHALSELVVLDRQLKSTSFAADLQLFRWCVSVSL